MDLNSVTISGRLTRDPELRHLPSGTAVVTIRIAHTKRRKIDGEWTDQAHFFDLVAYAGKAETVAKRLHKGDRIAAQGQLQHREWDAADGTHHQLVEILVDAFDYPTRSDTAPATDADE